MLINLIQMVVSVYTAEEEIPALCNLVMNIAAIFYLCFDVVTA